MTLPPESAGKDSAARTPENVITRALIHDGVQDSFRRASRQVLSDLERAGYAITDTGDGPGHYTREQVSEALNAAADLLSEHDGESSETIRQDDIVNLLVSGVMHLLDHPDAGLDEIIIAQYADLDIDDYDLDEGEEMPEKGSPRWNELVIARVRGWIE